MLERISINDLRIGMYVEAVTKQKGALKIKSQGRVRSQAIIDSLKLKGIIELAIDPDKTEPQAEPEQPIELPIAAPIEQPPPVSDPTERTVSFEQEANKAYRLYNQAKSLQKRTFADVIAGREINTEAMKEVANGFIDSVFRNQDALACISRIREKDAYLLEHSVNVSILMTILAKHMKLERGVIHQLATGALLHDIGKIKVDDKILHKPGKLTPEELIQMQRHAIYSREILQQTPNMDSISLEIASNHHERLNGTGYPRQLKAPQLSQAARMIAIVDCYDAMTAERVYKEGNNPITVFKHLKKDSGQSYDESLVNLFIQAIGIHPVGTLVKLKSQKLGIVTQTNFNDPLKPVVKVFYHAKHNHYTEIKDIDLTQSSDSIESSVKPENYKLDLPRFFKTAVLG